MLFRKLLLFFRSVIWVFEMLCRAKKKKKKEPISPLLLTK